MTYDHLHLHLPKHFCQLPLRPFPADYPKYPSRDQVVANLDDYQHHFHINPVLETRLETTVTRAEFATEVGMWVMTAERSRGKETKQIFGRVLVVAIVENGENGETVMPKLPGQSKFCGDVIHAKEYRNGRRFRTRECLWLGRGIRAWR